MIYYLIYVFVFELNLRLVDTEFFLGLGLDGQVLGLGLGLEGQVLGLGLGLVSSGLDSKSVDAL